VNLTPKIQKAINLASIAHLNQKRVGLNLPYIVHPFSVMLILSEFYQDENLLCAALLHDVIEDNENFSFKKIEYEFGEDVAVIIDGITERRTPNGSGGFIESWEERKARYLVRLSTAPKESVLVSVSDSIHNVRSLLETYEQCGSDIWNNFGASIGRKIKYYEKILEISKRRLDGSILVDKLEVAISKLKQATGKTNFTSQNFTLLSQPNVNSV